MEAAIEVDQISKCYRMGRGFPSLRSALGLLRESQSRNLHWAIKNVSFQVAAGEALGIIGPNGAGKTTILKILSRVTRPTTGQIRVKGRYSALIELGAGFHPDLTGRENIFLNGTILGMRRPEIKRRFDAIVDFAGIGEYLDTPVKRYSSGMYARLGFAIAAHVDPDVMLVDEVLAVGDFAFQAKCYTLMDELRRKGTCLIFVSHNFDAVRRVCDKGLVIYRGDAIFQGSAPEAVVAYSDAIRQAARKFQDAVPKEGGLSQRVMSFDAEIQQVRLLNSARYPVTMLRSGERACVVVDLIFHKDVHQPIFAMSLRTSDGHLVYDTTTRWQKMPTPDFSAGERCQVEYELDMRLLGGLYELSVDAAAYDLSVYHDRLERAMTFAVDGPDIAHGLVDLDAQIKVIRMDGHECSV